MSGAVCLVLDRSVRRRVPPGLRRVVVRRLARLVRAAGGPRARVELRLCDDAAMAALHAATFGDSHPTDVLSFPAGPPLPGPDAPRDAHQPHEDLGAIAINWDAVLRQAARPDPAAWTDEAVSLGLHSVAHLLGHDHRTRAEARHMLAAERRLGRRIGMIPRRPYGGAHGGER